MLTYASYHPNHKGGFGGKVRGQEELAEKAGVGKERCKINGYQRYRVRQPGPGPQADFDEAQGAGKGKEENGQQTRHP
jgi:hypothetical protein